MTRQPALARRAEELLASAVIATAPVAGGDICTANRLRLSDGRMVLMKTHPNPPEGFFEAEARSLSWLAAGNGGADGMPIPEVLAVSPDCLIIPWVEPGKVTGEAAVGLGTALATMHRSEPETIGLDEDGYIGRLPMRNAPAETWAEFYATRRVLPYLKLAADRGNVSAADQQRIESIIGKLPDLIPDEPPARLHGDLWGGNLVWGQDGRVWAVDPASYGGHREVDLAMLALFGVPHLPRIMDAYREAFPLADDFEDRVGLHQLFPLLVHAAMFGGSYGSRAAAIAARFSQ